MNWEVLGSVSELLAAVAVFASLVYVGRQVHDSATQTRINTSTTIASNAQDGWEPIYNSPEHSRIWRDGLNDITMLNDVELGMFLMLFDRQFFNYETAIVAFEAGAYDKDLFHSYTELLKNLIHSSGGRYWLENEDFSFTVTDRAKEYLEVA